MSSEPQANQKRPPLPGKQEEIESRLRGWIAEQISQRADEIPVDASFRSLGVTSVEAIALAERLSGLLNRKVDPVLLFDYPTIRSLAACLHAGTDQAPAAQAEQTQLPGQRNGIAIIGMACRFPGAKNLEAFWRLLVDGGDAIREVPAERWDAAGFYDPDPGAAGKTNTRWGGFLENIDQFDAAFFGISPREAKAMDPQQRLLLEVAWEALEDAGLPVEGLHSTKTGVFIGISSSEYGAVQLSRLEKIQSYSGTGSALSIAANRISYTFDFHGPSLAVDTACSSSLVAVHLACESLLRGESDLALAGGANLLLSPALAINFSKVGLMALDGRCKAFDARADGYVRSEGCGVVVLKPLAQALADHDPIYAVIRGSAMNQDGRTNGLISPSRRSQEELLGEAYRHAGVSPGQVQYVELHGTGTALGDSMEALALGAVLSQGRPAGGLCRVGSVKTNLGHLEAAAGIAGLIKTALAVKNRWVPKSLHFCEPSPLIPFDRLPLRVQESGEPWPESNQPPLAGVSSFGFGGTNAHVVLEGISRLGLQSQENEGLQAHWPQLLAMSAHNPAALQAQVEAFRQLLGGKPGEKAASFVDVCFSAGARRSHALHRIALIARSQAEAAEKLAGCERDQPSPASLNGSGGAAWIFSGQGSQWPGMGKTLLAREPVFRKALLQIQKVFSRCLGWDLFKVIASENPRLAAGEIDVVQPLIFAVQAGLAALWRSWGLKPQAIAGHSLGEAAAAYAAGALTLEDASRLVCVRSRLLKRIAGQGGMLAVTASSKEIQPLLNAFAGRVECAVMNGPTSIVLSGEVKALSELSQMLGRQGISCQKVLVDVAAHSQQVAGLQAELEQELAGLNCQPPDIPFYSSVTGERLAAPRLDAAYWGANLRQTVRFADVVGRLIEDGIQTFLEISPHPLLLGPVRQSLELAGKSGLTLPSLRRGEDERAVLLETLGALYTRGFNPAWQNLFPPSARFVRLPGTAWQRERCWLDEGVGPESPAKLSAGEKEHEASGAGQIEPGLLYRVAWEPAPLDPLFGPAGDGPVPRSLNPGRWLVIADAKGIGLQVTRLLEASGQTVDLIPPDANLEANRMNPGTPGGVQGFLGNISSAEAKHFRGILYLRNLDALPLAELDARHLLADQERICGGFIHVVQALAGLEGPRKPGLWLVCQGANALEQDGWRPAPPQAAAWGLGRAAGLEHPEFWEAAIDLDPAATAEACAQFVFNEISFKEDFEDQVAQRQGTRWIARMKPYELSSNSQEVRLRPDRSYLITGGLGGLGLACAQWLVKNGARRLILAGRTPLPDRSAWKLLAPRSPAGQAVQVIRALEAAGASIHLAALDVSDEGQVASFLKGYSDEAWPPVGGVIHAAGVLEDRLLAGVHLPEFLEVLKPKILGCWLLEKYLDPDWLEFFILFSSAAGVTGSPGQGSHAAANAFLDAFACDRRARGLPALSIAWGPWAQIGQAARAGRQEHLARLGIDLLQPEEGLEILSAVWHSPVSPVVVLRADWQPFIRQYPMRDPFLSQLLRPSEPEAGKEDAKETIAAGELHDLPVEQQRLWVGQYLVRKASRSLGLDAARLDPRESLTRLGFDSLMAIELKNRVEKDLGISVPLVHFLQGLTLEQLAAVICDQVESPVPQKVEPGRAGRDLAGEHPVSHGQGSLWFLQQLAPESSAYNIAFAFRIRSSFDVPAFSRALETMTSRHAAFRTVFAVRGDRPVQVVRDQVEAPLCVEDARGWTPAELDEKLSLESHRPFDLEKGPLWRVHIFSLAGEETVLAFNIHHAISDFWSLSVFIHELGIAYQAELEGRPAALPPLERHYIDYAYGQEQMLAGPEGERLQAYWLERLAGELPGLDLPTDRPRPPVLGYEGRSIAFRLEAGLSRAVRGLCRQANVTLYTMLLAAYGLLVHRYTGQEDLLVGSPMMGRSRPEFEGVVGYFNDPVVLRLDLSGSPSFEAFLERVRQVVLEAIDHQDYPFSLLVERLNPKRDPSRSPIYQTIFLMQQPFLASEKNLPAVGLGLPGEKMAWGGIQVEAQPFERRIAQMDLMLTMAEGEGESLLGAMQYNASLFERATIEQMIAHFQVILAGITRDPRREVRSLPILTGPEYESYVRQYNDTDLSFAGHEESLLDGLFEAQARRTPGAAAVITGDGLALTYAQLDRCANQVARDLVQDGAGRNRLVGVVMEKGWEQAAAVLGILKAGGAYLPVDPSLPDERKRYLLEFGEVETVLTQPALARTCTGGAAVVHSRIITPAMLDGEEALPPVVSGRTPEDLAYVIFTSGSTGVPKGVMIDHRGAVNTVLDINQRFRVSETDRCLSLSALNFDLSVYDLFGLLAAGGAVVLPRPAGRLEPGHWAELIHRHRATIWNSVPALLEMLVQQAGGGAGLQLGSLRLAMLSGDWIPVYLPDQARALCPGLEVVSLGGATEASIWSIYYPVGDVPPDWKSIPYGRPLANQRMYVLNDGLQPCPRGVTGQIFIGGIGLAAGYWRDPEKTVQKFIRRPESGERLYATGDLGRYLPGGEIEFLGRRDFQVKIQGHRIELGEIEAALEKHPGVRSAVVTAAGELRGYKRLVAYVVLSGNEIDLQELKQYLGAKLPEYMLPAVFIPLERLPVSANGKIDRSRLPVPEQAESGPGPEDAPRAGLETEIAALWAEILGCGRVGRQQNFFELGGHSLMATRLAARLAGRYQVELPLREFFSHPTVAETAGYIFARRAARQDAGPDLDGLLRRIAELSDEQVRALLGSQEPQ